MLTRSIRTAAAVCAVAALLAGCSSSSGAPSASAPSARPPSSEPGLDGRPSEATALSIVGQLATAATTKDWDAFCEVVGSGCSWELEDAEKETAPSDAPVILGTADVPGTEKDGVVFMGGRRVDVCGLDGAGAPYRSTMLMYEYNGALRINAPVFWITGGWVDSEGHADWTETDPRCPTAS